MRRRYESSSELIGSPGESGHRWQMKGSVHTDYAFNSVLQTLVTSDLHKLDAVGP